jgi:hypothetical protein
MILTIQALITLNCKNAKNTPMIRILSAKGSRNFPRSEIVFFLRAKYPSKKSVIEARIKTIKAISRVENLCAKINPIQIKAKRILKNVSLLAMLTSLHPH